MRKKADHLLDGAPPVGALTILEARTSRAPFYVVFAGEGFITKRSTTPSKWFFRFRADRNKAAPIRQIGYAFKNYLHAYAYSLKCKERSRATMDPS